jgi:hypothetical protein
MASSIASSSSVPTLNSLRIALRTSSGIRQVLVQHLLDTTCYYVVSCVIYGGMELNLSCSVLLLVMDEQSCSTGDSHWSRLMWLLWRGEVELVPGGRACFFFLYQRTCRSIAAMCRCSIAWKMYVERAMLAFGLVTSYWMPCALISLSWDLHFILSWPGHLRSVIKTACLFTALI